MELAASAHAALDLAFGRRVRAARSGVPRDVVAEETVVVRNGAVLGLGRAAVWAVHGPLPFGIAALV